LERSNASPTSTEKLNTPSQRSQATYDKNSGLYSVRFYERSGYNFQTGGWGQVTVGTVCGNRMKHLI